VALQSRVYGDKEDVIECIPSGFVSILDACRYVNVFYSRRNAVNFHFISAKQNLMQIDSVIEQRLLYTKCHSFVVSN
jgi:hypothetical protein